MEGTNDPQLNNALAGITQVPNGMDTSKLRILPLEIQYKVYQAALDSGSGHCIFQILLYDHLNAR